MWSSDVPAPAGLWVDGQTTLCCSISLDLRNQGARPVRHFAGSYNLSCSGISSGWVGITWTACLSSLTFLYILTAFCLSKLSLLFLTRALKCGALVLQLPSPPTDEEGGFIFIHHEDVRLSQKADEVYTQLIKLLKDQHEVTVLSLQKMFLFYLSFNISRILLLVL